MSLTAGRGLLSALHGREVRFVLIGGMAVIAHGYVRTTKDVDVVFDTSPENRVRLVAALDDLRAEIITADTLPPNGGISAEWLGEGDRFVFATEQGQLDALARTSVGTYEDLEPTSITTRLRDGSEISVVSYEDLIRLKEAAGRDRDRLDLEALRQLRETGDA